MPSLREVMEACSPKWIIYRDTSDLAPMAHILGEQFPAAERERQPQWLHPRDSLSIALISSAPITTGDVISCTLKRSQVCRSRTAISWPSASGRLTRVPWAQIRPRIHCPKTQRRSAAHSKD